MLSFGLTVVALASVVAPGVLFVVSLFTFSIIKRTAISLGPAIDVAVFFSFSLLINGLFGGAIGWLALDVYDPCGQRLLAEVNAVIGQLFGGSAGAGACSTQSAAAFCYLYLTGLCLVACVAGVSAVACVEWSGFRFAHGVFAKVSSVARRRGVTTCSALCKFGGENSFVIYIGEVQEIVLDDKNCITHLAIKKTQRSLLYVGLGITAADAAAIPFVSETDEFIIPGPSIENVAFSHVTRAGWPWKASIIPGAITLFVTGLLIVSVVIYVGMLLGGAVSGAGRPPPRADAPVAAPDATADVLVVPVPALKLLLEWDRQDRAVHDDALRTLTASVGALEATEIRLQAQANDLATKVGMLTANLTKLAADQAHGAGRLPRHHRAAPRQ